MKKFEYTVLDVPVKGFWWGGKINHEELSEKLNDLGRKGWEVISFGGTNQHSGGTRALIIILKKEITH